MDDRVERPPGGRELRIGAGVETPETERIDVPAPAPLELPVSTPEPEPEPEVPAAPIEVPA